MKKESKIERKRVKVMCPLKGHSWDLTLGEYTCRHRWLNRSYLEAKCPRSCYQGSGCLLKVKLKEGNVM